MSFPKFPLQSLILNMLYELADRPLGLSCLGPFGSSDSLNTEFCFGYHADFHVVTSYWHTSGDLLHFVTSNRLFVTTSYNHYSIEEVIIIILILFNLKRFLAMLIAIRAAVSHHYHTRELRSLFSQPSSHVDAQNTVQLLTMWSPCVRLQTLLFESMSWKVSFLIVVCGPRMRRRITIYRAIAASSEPWNCWISYHKPQDTIVKKWKHPSDRASRSRTAGLECSCATCAAANTALEGHHLPQQKLMKTAMHEKTKLTFLRLVPCSLPIHIPRCQKKWLLEEETKPEHERRPLPPQPSAELGNLGSRTAFERFNAE